MIGKITNINIEDATVEIAGQTKEGSYFPKGYLYSYTESYTTKEGKETNAVNWMINADGETKIKTGDVVEYFYEKVDGSEISTLKSIKKVGGGQNPTKPAYNAPKAGSGGGMTNKQLALIIGATYLSGKGVSDWHEFVENLSMISYAAEKDIEKLLKSI